LKDKGTKMIIIKFINIKRIQKETLEDFTPGTKSFSNIANIGLKKMMNRNLLCYA